MKKLAFLVIALTVGFGVVNAQTINPANCNNAGVLAADIQANEAQGYVLVGYDYQPINYLVQPDPPYLGGTLTLTFAPDCEPLEPCPKILRASFYNITVVNDNGTCLYQKQ